MTAPERCRPLAVLLVALCLGACASSPPPAPPDGPKAHLPLLRGWFGGEEVLYVTTDVSDANVARAKDGNYAPRLAAALPRDAASLTSPHGERAATDRVYSMTNHVQGSVFASAPLPMGAGNTDLGYSPLWQLVEVTWRLGRAPRLLTSEEAVLAAADEGDVTLRPTRVVLNCPIVHRGAKGGLTGVTVDPAAR